MLSYNVSAPVKYKQRVVSGVVGCTHEEEELDKDKRRWKKSRGSSPRTVLGDGSSGRGTTRSEALRFNKRGKYWITGRVARKPEL